MASFLSEEQSHSNFQQSEVKNDGKIVDLLCRKIVLFVQRAVSDKRLPTTVVYQEILPYFASRTSTQFKLEICRIQPVF